MNIKRLAPIVISSLLLTGLNPLFAVKLRNGKRTYFNRKSDIIRMINNYKYPDDEEIRSKLFDLHGDLYMLKRRTNKPTENRPIAKAAKKELIRAKIREFMEPNIDGDFGFFPLIRQHLVEYFCNDDIYSSIKDLLSSEFQSNLNTVCLLINKLFNSFRNFINEITLNGWAGENNVAYTSDYSVNLGGNDKRLELINDTWGHIPQYQCTCTLADNEKTIVRGDRFYMYLGEPTTMSCIRRHESLNVLLTKSFRTLLRHYEINHVNRIILVCVGKNENRNGAVTVNVRFNYE